MQYEQLEGAIKGKSLQYEVIVLVRVNQSNCSKAHIACIIIPDISIKSNKLHFQSCRKTFSDAPLAKLLPRYQEIIVASDITTEHSLQYFSDTSKLAGSKLTRFRVCLSSFQYIIPKFQISTFLPIWVLIDFVFLSP